MAIVHLRSPVWESHPTVVRFGHLLAKIEAASDWKMTEEKIAGDTHLVWDVLQEHGDDITLLEFMEECCRACEGEEHGVTYTEILQSVAVATLERSRRKL